MKINRRAFIGSSIIAGLCSFLGIRPTKPEFAKYQRLEYHEIYGQDLHGNDRFWIATFPVDVQPVWRDVEFENLRKGDLFRYKPGHHGQDGSNFWVAISDPQPEGPPSYGSILCEPGGGVIRNDGNLQPKPRAVL